MRYRWFDTSWRCCCQRTNNARDPWCARCGKDRAEAQRIAVRRLPLGMEAAPSASVPA